MKKRIQYIVVFLFVIAISLYVGWVSLLEYNKMYSQINIHKKTFDMHPDLQKQKFIPQFTNSREGIKNIAYISMIKDEEDIIYENLVWHFVCGFRKFILVDNNSTDGTKTLIDRFIKETKGIATIILIDDPIEEHNQNKIITGSYRMAHEIWPEVEWFFPIDADEFWVFSRNPSEAIAMIPKWVDSVSVMKSKYYPSNDYDAISDGRFWHKIHYRQNQWAEFDIEENKSVVIPKVFLRYSKHFSICMGNHHVLYNGPFSIIEDEESEGMYNNILDDVRYVTGDEYGIFMREFHMRSVKQTQKKFTNGLIASEKMQKSNKRALKAGSHWFKYKEYLSKYETPEEAAENKFKNYYRYTNIIDDRLQIDEALELYKSLISGN